MRVVWTKAHTTLEEKANMTQRTDKWVNEKVDELANIGTNKVGAEVAERIAKDALHTRKKVYAGIRYAATFHDEVEEFCDVE